MRIRTQKFISGLYVFERFDYIREEIEGWFALQDENIGSNTARDKIYRKQFMVTLGNLIWILEGRLEPAFTDQHSDDVKTVIGNLKAIREAHPEVLIDMEN